MPQERTRQGNREARDAHTESARDALEHPHILFRFQRDPLAAAMQNELDRPGVKSAARQMPKRRASR